MSEGSGKSGFDRIYHACRGIVRKLPLAWWLFYLAIGSIAAHILPLASLVRASWVKLVEAHTSYWISAILFALSSAAVTAFIRHAILSDRIDESAKNRDLESDYPLLDDAPLNSDEHDELERTALAETVAPLLVLPPGGTSIAIALEADWGEGKSSLLTLIEQRLSRFKDNPLVIRFNPWFVHSREQVVSSFFAHVIGSIASAESADSDAVIQLQSYVKVLTSMADKPTAGLTQALFPLFEPDTSLIARKEQLGSTLVKLGRPVIVIVDDIDRLPKEDIRCIFQLVKIVGDFPRFSYLLAFDPAPIDRALRFDGLYRNGKSYREKVVQLTIRVPTASFSVRRAYFEKRLVQRIDRWSLALRDDDRHVLNRIAPLAVRGLSTPREIKRLLNNWCLSCRMLGEDVNHGDILLMEMLQWKFPLVFNALLKDPRRLAGSGLIVDDYESKGMRSLMRSHGKDDADRQKTLLADLQRLHPNKEDHDLLEEIVDELFPNRVSGIRARHDDSEPTSRRVRDRDILEIYFGKRIPSGVPSGRSIRNFYTDPSIRAGLLEDAVNSGSLGATLVFLRQQMYPLTDHNDFIERVAASVLRAWTIRHENHVEDAERLLKALIKKLPPEEMKDALKYLVSSSKYPTLAEAVLSSILNECGARAPFEAGPQVMAATLHGEWSALHPSVLSQATAEWLENVRKFGVRRLVEEQPDFISALFRWGQFEDPQYETVRRAIDEYIDGPKEATAFSYGFAPRSGLNMSVDGVEKLLINPKKFMDFLQSGSPLSSVLSRFLEKLGP